MLFTADRIHDGKGWLPENTIIETDDNGTILSVYQSENREGVTVLEGLLAPGFVNVHCHLELSHMKGVVPKHTGLIGFLKQIPALRNSFSDEQKRTARKAAYEELYVNGTVAVGDIANTSDALDVRALGKMHIHTFTEALGFNPAPERMYGYAQQAFEAYNGQEGNGKMLRQSMVPHAPYSVSQPFFSLIDQHQPESIISIHNQECCAENEFYISKDGMVRDLLSGMGIDDSFFVPSGKTSLQTYLEWISPTHPVIFIHNTFTTKEDIDTARRLMPQTFWCLCPNANLYIENTLPDVPLFIKEGLNICVGTDSLASNHQLSILSELTTLKKNFSELDWEILLTWATLNGARALQMQHVIGSIEVGKQPGLVQIRGLGSDVPTIKRII
ncbi:MAG: amidohydrolase [Sphingobacteriales bacterium]|nr:MAG: amidohydrolase [Sphingobacteriales bacterium]